MNKILDKLLDILSEKEEENFKIDVENPGLLEVPEGKNVQDLPVEHFKKLIDKKGWEAISRGLINLKIWNKSKNPSLASWANSMHDKLSKWVENRN